MCIRDSTNVDTGNLSLSLDDGKKYQAPEEFNFEGLEPGVKVLVFYTEVDGKRVINDLEIIQSVSYTHLDVYKRQDQQPGRVDGMPLRQRHAD